MFQIKKEVYKNKTEQIIQIYNELYFYGSKATTELAHKIAHDIESDWNEPKGEVIIEGFVYTVNFTIKGFYKPDLQKNEVERNTFAWKKFFRIEEHSKLHVSYVDNIRSNTGWFMLKNVITEGAKTPAHELGHCWGLLHPKELDYRGKGQPHIMFPRGTFVDAEFRYKPEAEIRFINGKWETEEGFTMHTDKRKVTHQNILDLQLDELEYDEDGYADLSMVTSTFHGV